MGSWVESSPEQKLSVSVQAYYIFSIGNIKPILKAQYSDCYKTFEQCPKTLTQIPDYIQIVGIVCGMITIGYLGDRIGRKWGSVTTVSIMGLGAVLLTVQNAPTEKGQLIFYIVAQFIFGCVSLAGALLLVPFPPLAPCTHSASSSRHVHAFSQGGLSERASADEFLIYYRFRE